MKTCFNLHDRKRGHLLGVIYVDLNISKEKLGRHLFQCQLASRNGLKVYEVEARVEKARKREGLPD
jgi:hypothetical protein